MNVDKIKELLEMLGASKKYQQGGNIQPLPSRETSIGPIPWGGISQQGILDMIIGGGGMGRIAKTAKNVIPYITGRNVKAVQNIKAHNQMDKLISQSDNKVFLEKLKTLNPGSKIVGRGIQLPDAPVAGTPTSGGGIMDILKKLLPWGLLGTTGDTQE